MDRSGGADSCWEWQSARTRNGYGVLGMGGKSIMYAHRLAYVLAVGDIADDLVIMHSCDNPPCCNPAHLTPGTKAENAADMVRKGRNSPPPIMPGESNANAKLTTAQVIDMRERYASGDGLAMLSAEYGVARDTVMNIVHGKAWKTAGGPIVPAGAFDHLRPAPMIPAESRRRGQHHPNAKLTNAQAERLRQRHKDGLSLSALAREYGVSTTTVMRIVRREVWRDVP